MKKKYITPNSEVITIEAPQLLDVSGGGKGIGYGGKDIGGSEDPSSREFDDIFDDLDILPGI